MKIANIYEKLTDEFEDVKSVFLSLVNASGTKGDAKGRKWFKEQLSKALGSLREVRGGLDALRDLDLHMKQILSEHLPVDGIDEAVLRDLEKAELTDDLFIRRLTRVVKTKGRVERVEAVILVLKDIAAERERLKNRMAKLAERSGASTSDAGTANERETARRLRQPINTAIAILDDREKRVRRLYLRFRQEAENAVAALKDW